MFLLGILIFKGLTARRLYKSFGVKGLKFLHSRNRTVTQFRRNDSKITIFLIALHFAASPADSTLPLYSTIYINSPYVTHPTLFVEGG
jgi:hypothetical protein